MTDIVEQAKKYVRTPVKKNEIMYHTFIVSTGSTLLDLAISGGYVEGGGLPVGGSIGGYIVEIFGLNSTGKTTLISEICASAQKFGGEVRYLDPEGRLNPKYCETFGIQLNTDNYFMPRTVTDVFGMLIGPIESKGRSSGRDKDKAWTPDKTKPNVMMVDSLAALSTEFELEQGDKMGQRRAKEFSEGLRVSSVHIKEHSILLVCSNQVRDSGDMYGEKTRTPGGHGIPFYSTLRIRLTKKGKIEKEVEVRGRKTKKIIGIDVEAFVYKSTLDNPYRSAPIRLLFNYGIDDIGANLQWLKDNGGFDVDGKKGTSYIVDDKKVMSLEKATALVEEEAWEDEIRTQVISLWNEIEKEGIVERKRKVR